MPQTMLLLANMGGPSGPDEVEPYLRAIFADPAILPVPDWLRSVLGAWIACRRAPRVTERYRSIGGSSPLPKWTERQVQQVGEALAAQDRAIPVRHAFRYTSPTIEQVLAEEARAGVRRVVLLPLFPHHTDAMTGSIEGVARDAAGANGISLEVIGAWGSRPDVIELWRSMLAEALAAAGAGGRVLFVAHGIPMRSVRRGEDYPDRVADTARSLAETLPAGTDWSLAYQSRVGPVRWTGPYLDEELDRLVRSSAPLVIMPLSFVADCLETLYDLDQIAADRARRAGIHQVLRVRAFNDDPAFGRVLAQMVIEQLDTQAGPAARPDTAKDDSPERAASGGAP